LHAPFSFAGTAWQMPLTVLQAPTTHVPFNDEQSRGVPAHTPALQVSFSVQINPSLHVPPWFVGCAWHNPVAALHTPRLHEFVSPLQFTAVPAQTPALQTSPVVQLFPSVHVCPWLIGWAMHCPFRALHTPSVQGPSRPSQLTGAPLHVPPPQTSPVVQLLPSLHAFVLFTYTHTPAGHDSVVHGFPSAQSAAMPHF
jgi:hypothetical protein